MRVLLRRSSRRASGRILSTLNWLRAGVLGANDGIGSTAAIIFGVAGASGQPRDDHACGHCRDCRGSPFDGCRRICVGVGRAPDDGEGCAFCSCARRARDRSRCRDESLGGGFGFVRCLTIGGLVPILAMLLSPQPIEIWVAGVAVVLAMAMTGVISARVGHFPVMPSVIRNVAGGLLAMAVTYGVGKFARTQL